MSQVTALRTRLRDIVRDLERERDRLQELRDTIQLPPAATSPEDDDEEPDLLLEPGGDAGPGAVTAAPAHPVLPGGRSRRVLAGMRIADRPGIEAVPKPAGPRSAYTPPSISLTPLSNCSKLAVREGRISRCVDV